MGAVACTPLAALEGHLPETDGSTSAQFEIVYGHAFKPAPRVRVFRKQDRVPAHMRAMLRKYVPQEQIDSVFVLI